MTATHVFMTAMISRSWKWRQTSCKWLQPDNHILVRSMCWSRWRRRDWSYSFGDRNLYSSIG